VVPSDFSDYFAAAATGAGALIGLLFVSVSLRTDSIFGAQATAAGQALAGSAFAGLVNAFFVAIIALIPRTNIGITAIIMGTSSTIAVLRLDRRLPGRKSRAIRLAFNVATFLVEIAVGITLVVHPHSAGEVGNLAYVLVALFSVALNRAWALLKGEHTKSVPAAEGLKGAEPKEPAERKKEAESNKGAAGNMEAADMEAAGNKEAEGKKA
jgi:hypothetical protein